MKHPETDVLVVGGGHAGVEAAAAAARMGARVVMVTFDPARVGALSCNPSIGGVGKGHLARELDALDGIMAIAADEAAIHYRLLNRSKGAAVQGPRVQVDRRHYAAAVQRRLAAEERLSIIAGEVAALELAGGTVTGVRLADGTLVHARAIVLATGTFLGGRLFRGEAREEGGRFGESAARRLAEQLAELKLPLARLKTGTPPRLDGRRIDWARLAEQPSDTDSWTMSAVGRRTLPQLFCAVTRTTPQTHDIIRDGLDRSPLFTGAIGAAGPRYCPSIEDKVHRFGDRDGHQIFLEPEGLNDHTVYPNGISTSLPVDVQVDLVRSIPGLEQVDILVPGYAVEYVHLDPRSLDASLTLRDLSGLFCAGQINGTTGYEEAAGQGLVAGINAAALALGRAPLKLDRASSYLGVMIDDLVLQGVTEPYRMLTARAEYRLHLRADNAETRLCAIGEEVGCLSRGRIDSSRRRHADRRRATDWLAEARVGATGRATVAELIRQGAGARELAPPELPESIIAEVIEDARYAPYVARQQDEVTQLRASEAVALPSNLVFQEIAGLSNEMIDRLERARPETLGAASRVRGVTPAALTAILMHSRRRA